MAMEHARSFVEKFFDDDEFIKVIIRKRNFNKNENTTNNIENEKMVQIANEMGFKFDIDEYEFACKEYMNELGGWEAAKKIFHMIEIASAITKENSYDL